MANLSKEIFYSFNINFNSFVFYGEAYNQVYASVISKMIEQALRHTKGNQSEAARLLGINRGTLRNYAIKSGLI